MILGSAITLVSSNPSYDPNRGFEMHLRYRGTRDAIQSLAQSYVSLGTPADVTDEGGAAWLDVRLQHEGEVDGRPETPTDTWEWSRDFAVESIWQHPSIHAIMVAYAPGWGVGVDDAVAYFRKIVTAALKGKQVSEVSPLSVEGDIFTEISEGPLTPTATGFTGNLLKVYTLLSRGAEGFEFERCVLDRRRSFSVRFATRMTLDVIPKVYTTAALIATFNVPAIIESQLPAAPATTPTDAVWAWKMRSQKSQVNWHGKVEETQQWVFAAWSTLTYTLVST